MATQPSSSIGAVLLAAGAGVRIGGRPKALLELDGIPLVVRQLRALADSGVDELVVVLGTHAERIQPLIERVSMTAPRITVLHNPRPSDGQISSQRQGLGALRCVDAVMVALVDQPLITSQDLAALIAAFRKRDDGISVVVPRVAGQPGNPVIFTAAVRDEILAAGEAFGCREWRRVNPEQVAHFDTSNHCFVFDVDSVEDIVRLEHETGRTLYWPGGVHGSK
jgi:molybdenum cofactor cytidylyltransferase